MYRCSTEKSSKNWNAYKTQSDMMIISDEATMKKRPPNQENNKKEIIQNAV